MTHVTCNVSVQYQAEITCNICLLFIFTRAGTFTIISCETIYGLST